MEFSLEDIITLLKKRLIFIALCTFIGLSAFYLYKAYMVKPIYTASVQMYVSPNNSTSLTNINDLNYAQRVVTTYINFLQTKVFYKEVVEESGLNYSPDQLRGMTIIQAVNNTEIFQISVTSLDPEDSFSLVEAMQKVAPKLIKRVMNTADISVVDPAVLPAGPAAANIMKYTIVGGMLGLLLSFLASFLWEIIDVNVKNQEDLVRKYKLPILGAIPNYKRHKNRNYLLRKIRRIVNRHIKSKDTEENIDKGTNFIVTEAYKALRTNLRFTLLGNGCKRLLVSSPIPEDGKSTVSINIAITIAQTGARVLLLDCDLRKGRLHSHFHIRNVPGVSETLSDMVGEKDVIQSTQHENLNVITMGAIPPNPIELLSSIQMEELIAKLEKSYDYIIIDSPPVNVISDALSLVKLVNGVVIVVREGVTSHPNIASALTKYKLAGANILGFVLNGDDRKEGYKSKSGYNYYQ